MSTNTRNGNKWTVNELLSLQREYELLEWTVEQIADKHQRTVNAIMFKLDAECIAQWGTARTSSSQPETETKVETKVETECKTDIREFIDEYVTKKRKVVRKVASH